MHIARKITVTLALFLSATIGTQAQENTCASGHIHNQLMVGDSLYARNIFYLNRRIIELQEEFAQRAFEEVHVIPTVIHILHEGEEIGLGSNISDAQIMSAMEALNEDFRKMTGTNGDGDGVDVELEFCLASRDPDGNSTNGIVRVDASVIEDYAEMGIEASSTTGADEAATKALSTWPREDYMNVWIVNEIENNDAGGGVQGYAYFPMNSPLDGIVILHNAFGTVGNLKPNTAFNRTFTHEVGHFIGLYHTFHDTDDCNDETNCETQGDRVCDTPDTPLSASCWEPECEGTQQVENYMDYTAETCRNMFTQGQKDRMRATLEADRPTLMTSLGCVPVTDYDAGISAIQAPNGTLCDAAVSPIVLLTNYGSETLTSVDIEYDISGGSALTYGWTGSLDPGGTEEVTLPIIVGSAGNHTLNVQTVNPNGQTDQYTDNDGVYKAFAISSGATISLDITVDYFGAETTWDLYDDEGNLVDEGGPYINNNQGTVFTESICASAGCFTFSMHDTYGDGQSFTNGSYELTDSEGNVLASGSGNWGDDAVHDFCLEEEAGGQAPTANFSADDSGICIGESVDFNDLSLNNPSSWTWTFEGGSPSSHNGQNPPPVTYNSAGNYDVTLSVTNAEGSDSYTLSGYINVYDNPTLTLDVTDVSCAGAADGAIAADADGFGSITYDWSTGHSGTSISGQDAGNYDLTVTDSQGCTSSASATIDEPEAITLNVSHQDIGCFGADDGSASASASGGAGGITLSWSNNSSSGVINDLAPGIYTVTATDANGCSAQQSVEIDEPEQLLLNLFDFDIACNGGLGSAEVDPSGGTAPYDILWSNSETSNAISDLNPGVYSVVVTDEADCSVTGEFEISETEELTLQVTIDQISCPGESDGAASVVVMGGSGEYTYEWSTGHTWTSVSGLAVGDYWVTAEDDAGCTGQHDFTISEPAALSLTIFKTDISCYGLADGTATATPSGGTAPYMYEWSNGSEENLADGLPQGTVTCTVMDDGACEVSESVEIVEPSAIILTVEQTSPESCTGMDGAGTLNIMGGTPAYQVLWSNGSTEQVLEGVTSGSYLVNVTDGNGCTSNTELTIDYDCANPPQASELTDEYCGAQHLELDQTIDCDEVAGAEMYQWKFENQSLGLFSEEYTIAGNTSFYLADVTGLGYDMMVFVSIKVLKDGMWSPYGTECQIWTAVAVPGTQLTVDYCGVTGLYVGDYVETEEVAGAYSYEWHITGPGLDEVFTSYVNSMAFTSDLGIEEGAEYHVQTRAQVEDLWSEWGAVCTVQFDFGSTVTGLFDDDLTVSFFPNPNPGDQISISLSKLSDNASVSHFELYSSTGKLIETFRLTESSDDYTRTEHRFHNRLSSGMYFIKYELNGSHQEEKLIVR